MNAEELAEMAGRVKRERKRRGWSQKELAAQTGVVSMGTVSNFERRKYTPQPEHLRAILHALDLEQEAGDERAKETREAWPADVKLFLDVLGVYLMRLPEERRTRAMHDLTRRAFKGS